MFQNIDINIKLRRKNLATTFIKTLIVYIFVLTAIRLMGKRELGQLQPFELVVIIMIADVASVPMQNAGTPILQGIVPILALLTGEIIVSFLNIKFQFFHKILTGKPAILVKNGQIIETNLTRQRYGVEELLEQIRVAGYPDIRDIEYVILETSGQVSIIPKPEKNVVTLQDMNLTVNKVGYPRVIIFEGKLFENNLKYIGYNQEWLRKKLKERKVAIKDIFVLIADESGGIYFQEKREGQ